MSILRIRWPKYWSFGFSGSPPNEYSGFISLRIDWSSPAANPSSVITLLLYSLYVNAFWKIWFKLITSRT